MPSTHGAGRDGVRLGRWLGWFIAGCLLGTSVMAEEAPKPPAKDEFSSLVKLAPFFVSGKSLAISIYARTRSDRRYGEEFSERVVKVVYEAVTESTGKGLVIIGAKGEPHPTFVFQKFLALAKDGKLDPEVAARGPELSTMLDHWQHSLHAGESVGGDKDEIDVDLDFEKIFTALPLPLVGVGAKLYQLAWEEKFNDAKVEAKLCALRPGDLERRDRFKSFEWVFYLPPKGAFDHVLDGIVADALKQEKMGFLARTAVKGALLVVKPKIRRAIEAMREGMMFMTVVKAETPYSEEEVSEVTEAYIEVFLPFDTNEKKPRGSTDHERAVNAVRDRLRESGKNSEPSVEPAETETVRGSRSRNENTTKGASPTRIRGAEGCLRWEAAHLAVGGRRLRAQTVGRSRVRNWRMVPIDHFVQDGGVLSR